MIASLFRRLNHSSSLARRFFVAHFSSSDAAFPPPQPLEPRLLLAGDPPEFADDHGDSAATATAIEIPGEIGGVIETNGDHDWFGFEAQAGSLYTFRVNLGTLGDSLLRLIGTNGTTILVTDDDSNGGLASRIDWLAPVSGQFYLRVEGFQNQFTGSYTLLFTSGSGVDDHGQTAATATPAAVNQLLEGHIQFAGDLDWFAFSANAGQTYTLRTFLDGPTGYDLQDSVLSIIDRNGVTQIAANDNDGLSLSSRLEFTPTISGTYYAEVRSFNPARVGTYGLQIDTTPLFARGDTDRDGDIDDGDIDTLFAHIRNGAAFDAALDLTGDSLINQDDVDELVEGILATFYGDVDLNLTVSLGDLILMAASFDQPGGWGQGDSTGDGLVTLGDLILMAANFDRVSPGPPPALTGHGDGEAGPSPSLLAAAGSSADEDEAAAASDIAADILAELASGLRA